MLVVRFDPTRSIEIGQFYVSLVEPDFYRLKSGPEWEGNRLGYWCDEEHLRTFFTTITYVIEEAHSPVRAIKTDLRSHVKRWSKDYSGESIPHRRMDNGKCCGCLHTWPCPAEVAKGL